MNESIIILTGGNSKRMGHPKYALRFGAETLLQRTLRNLEGSDAMVIVVAAPEQDLPDLGETVVVRDPVPDQGPLLAITTGLKEASKIATDAFVIGCDMPFVTHRHLRALASYKKASDDIVIPQVGSQFYPLCALYDTHVWTTGRALLDRGERRLLSLLNHCRVNPVGEDALLALESDLRFLTNINTPQAYQEALEDAKLKG